jgi:hypothetical protein
MLYKYNVRKENIIFLTQNSRKKGMVIIWNKALDCCKTLSNMTSEHQGIIAYYQNDLIDEDSEKGEDGEGYYFVIDDKGLPIGNKLLYCPYCGTKIK